MAVSEWRTKATSYMETVKALAEGDRLDRPERQTEQVILWHLHEERSFTEVDLEEWSYGRWERVGSDCGRSAGRA